jgi:hypothetical protein
MTFKNSLYIISLATLVGISTVSLAAIGQTGLDVYVSVFVIIYFAMSAIFSPRRRVRFDFLGLALFCIFAIIVAFRVASILGIQL